MQAIGATTPMATFYHIIGSFADYARRFMLA
jgi:hypothetical protein